MCVHICVYGLSFVCVRLCARMFVCVPLVTPQVISARRGEFETGFDNGGQTREHAMLAKTAGVRKVSCLCYDLCRSHYRLVTLCGCSVCVGRNFYNACCWRGICLWYSEANAPPVWAVLLVCIYTSISCYVSLSHTLLSNAAVGAAVAGGGDQQDG